MKGETLNMNRDLEQLEIAEKVLLECDRRGAGDY